MGRVGVHPGVTTGQIVLLLALAAALGFGAWRAVVDGRFGSRRRAATEVAPEEPSLLAGTPFEATLGERATLLQFSSAFCAPCRATRQVLGDVAGVVPGVAHVEVDAEQHLALVRQLQIMRTPTTVVLDARGHEVARAAGAPRKEQVLAALGEALPDVP